jgi:hypothetical protein
MQALGKMRTIFMTLSSRRQEPPNGMAEISTR